MNQVFIHFDLGSTFLLAMPFEMTILELQNRVWPKKYAHHCTALRGFESLQGFSGFAVVKIGFGSSSLLLQLLVVQMHNVRALFLSDSHSNIQYHWQTLTVSFVTDKCTTILIKITFLLAYKTFIPHTFKIGIYLACSSESNS